MSAEPSQISTTPVNAFRLEREGDLGILWFDLPGEKVNKFSAAVMTEFNAIVDDLARQTDLKRLLVASKKSGIFIAGADVTEFGKVTSEQQAEEYTRFGQQVFVKFSRLPQITVALIDGACMGGGTELSLNCDYRLATDAPKTKIALPETQLGIFPAWSGTTLLPRLIGIPAALDMILTPGRNHDGRRAKKIGLVDEVVPAATALEEAKKYTRKLTAKGGSRGRTHLYLEGNPLARKFVFNKARAAVKQKTGGHYPAPLTAINVMELGFSKGIDAGLAAESREAAKLIMGEVAQNLVRLFFMMEDAKKDSGPKAAAVRKAGVLGAGVMGGGIAQIVVDKADIPVRMKDINWSALGGGMKAAAKLWKKKVERRRMKRNEMETKLARITSSVDWSGFADTDVVIEAVVENLGIKQSVLAEYEAVAQPTAIFATNTSTIPITEIAAKAQRPENVVGMHFFNPVDRMPLVEVIAGEKTSAETVSTIASFARKLGKTVVICKDGPGFVVNRILGPYMNEAALLLEEGNSIEAIDKAMTDFGMPMGPMALLDEVGIDVANKAAHVLATAFAGRMTEPKSLAALLADNRLGKKNGRGVYLWKEGKRIGPDPAVYALVGVKGSAGQDSRAIVERMVFAMTNEASLILQEGIVGSAAELDLAMIMGTGFPPFRGGLLRYSDSMGVQNVVTRMEALAKTAGPRFEPSALLKELAASGGTFYGRYAKK